MIFRRRGGIFGFGILGGEEEKKEEDWEEFDKMMKEDLMEMWEKLVIEEYDFGEDP